MLKLSKPVRGANVFSNIDNEMFFGSEGPLNCYKSTVYFSKVSANILLLLLLLPLLLLLFYYYIMIKVIIIIIIIIHMLGDSH